MAANVAVTYNFTAGTPAVADNVDQNFTDIVNWINTNAVHLDGSKAFTAIPSGPATDPTTANQLTRKAYVDAQVASRHNGTMGYTSLTTGQAGIGGSFTTLSFGGTNLAVTFTAVAGRRYKVTTQVRVLQNTSSGVVEVRVVDGASTVYNTFTTNVTATAYATCHMTAVVTGLSAGSQTLTIQGRTTVGTVDTVFSGPQPGFILVEDIGV